MPCLQKNEKNTNKDGVKKITPKDHEKRICSEYNRTFQMQTIVFFFDILLVEGIYLSVFSIYF